MHINKSMLGVVRSMPCNKCHYMKVAFEPPSFRFGDAIADVANSLLGALNETVPLLQSKCKSSVE